MESNYSCRICKSAYNRQIEGNTKTNYIDNWLRNDDIKTSRNVMIILTEI